MLPSPYETTGGLVYFPRMTAKIRLHFANQLPEDYKNNLGSGFDGRCCHFLRLDYSKLYERVAIGGGTDEEILAWAYDHGRQPDAQDIEIWNGFMTKRGWRDDFTTGLQQRIRNAGLPTDGTILTAFDFLDADEGRPPRELKFED